jgi:hypothetical protein
MFVSCDLSLSSSTTHPNKYLISLMGAAAISSFYGCENAQVLYITLCFDGGFNTRDPSSKFCDQNHVELSYETQKQRHHMPIRNHKSDRVPSQKNRPKCSYVCRDVGALLSAVVQGYKAPSACNVACTSSGGGVQCPGYILVRTPNADACRSYSNCCSIISYRPVGS